MLTTDTRFFLSTQDDSSPELLHPGTITTAGYPCQPLVQRSPDHPEPYANDIVNYLRLSRRLEPGDRLVFDGGFVFDSVYRTIMENDISAVWLRRGLWQPCQSGRRKQSCNRFGLGTT